MKAVVDNTVTRRSAMAGIGSGGLGAALALGAAQASAQDSTQVDMAGHPMVGTWIVVRDIESTSAAPSIVVYSADGGLLDPSQGVAGAWHATGSRSAEWTLIVILDGGAGGYVVVPSNGEISEDGTTLDGPNSFTVVGPDGMVMMSGEAQSHYTRLVIEPFENGGKPIAGFPTWVPEPAPEATPAS